MALDTFIGAIERVGTTADGILAGQMAMVFRSAAFTVTVVDGVVRGPKGETITGYYLIDLPTYSTGDLHVTGTLTVDGTSALTGDVTMAAALSVGTSLDVAGNSALAGDVLLGGVTGTGATLSGPSDFSLYVAPAASSTASVALFEWSGATTSLRLGYDAATATYTSTTTTQIKVGSVVGLSVTSAGAVLGPSGGSVALYGGTPVAQASRVGQLTDSTGGSATGALGAGIVDTIAKDAIASLAAKVNALELVLHNLRATT